MLSSKATSKATARIVKSLRIRNFAVIHSFLNKYSKIIVAEDDEYEAEAVFADEGKSGKDKVTSRMVKEVGKHEEFVERWQRCIGR